MDKNRIVVDPGLGFGKRKEENTALIAALPEFRKLEVPILIGPSKKTFLKQATDTETAFASAAAVAASILGGAHMVRVHDLKEMAAAAWLADAVIAGRQ